MIETTSKEVVAIYNHFSSVERENVHPMVSKAEGYSTDNCIVDVIGKENMTTGFDDPDLDHEVAETLDQSRDPLLQDDLVTSPSNLQRRSN